MYFVPGVAGRPMQDEIVYLTVTTELEFTTPSEESSRMKGDRTSDDVNRLRKEERTRFVTPDS